MSKMPCSISDGPDYDDWLESAQITEADPDAAYDEARQSAVDRVFRCNTQRGQFIEPGGCCYTIPIGSARSESMSVEVTLIEQTEPCASCESDDERWVIEISRLIPLEDASSKCSDQYCLHCASTVSSRLERLLREVPKI